MDIAEIQAQMVRMKRENEELKLSNQEFKTSNDHMRNSFVENNKPRFTSAVDSWRKHEIKGVDDATMPEFALMFGEQKYAPVANLLENLTTSLNGKDAELQRVTTAVTSHETDLKARDEEITTLKAHLSKYQGIMKQNRLSDADTIFEAHDQLMDTPLPASGHHSMVADSYTQPQAVHASNNPRPQKRARTETEWWEHGQGAMMAALDNTPLMSHGQIRQIKK